MANAKKKRRRKVVVFSAIGLVLIGLTLLAIFRKREVVFTVQTEKAARRNLTEIVVANGRIQPVLQVKISPEVSGEIIELAVKEGQQVNKGDLLLRIKPDFYSANLRSAEASFKASQSSRELAIANLKKAELEFKRNEELYHVKLISDSDFIGYRTTYDCAKASAESSGHQVEVARAARSRAEEELSKTTIVSPLCGTVSKLNSELGERVVGTAMMSGTEIMTIADLNAMEARVDIGEMDVVLIAPGQKARLEVDAFRDRKFNGTVTEIANSSKGSGQSGMGGGSSQGQEATRFEVKIRVTEKEAFRPGMSVTAEIETRSRTNVITVPIQSVTTRLPKSPGDKKPGSKEAKTYAANTTVQADVSSGSSTNKTGKKANESPKPIEVVFVKASEQVKMVPVKRGISDDNYTEIIDGLDEGKEVVSGGFKAISRDLEDGKKVKIGKAESKPEKETR